MAYTVVFTHSVVPHQHHEQKEHAGAHHHDDEEDHHDDDSHDFSEDFQLYQHQGAAEDFVHAIAFNALTVTKQFVAVANAIQRLVNLCDEGPPLKYLQTRLYHFSPQQEHFYFFSVKAPPALS